jgi:hypothetical protein
VAMLLRAEPYQVLAARAQILVLWLACRAVRTAAVWVRLLCAW